MSIPAFGRQDFCWCGSGKTYRLCHKQWSRPRSEPGQKVPPDQGDQVFIAPSIAVSKALLVSMMPKGTPLTFPRPETEPRANSVSALESMIAGLRQAGPPLSTREIGRLRVEMLRRLASLPDRDVPVKNEVLDGIAQASALAWQTVGALGDESFRPNVLWNEAMDGAKFLGQTLLLADHILSPDQMIKFVDQGGTSREIRAAAKRELRNESLISEGRLISIPSGSALTIGEESAYNAARRDLQDPHLRAFVDSQLVMEGPTAREFLLVNAIDDLDLNSKFWMYARMDPGSVKGREFAMKALGEYDPGYDYSPWITQVRNEAIAHYIQRTVNRLTVSELIGAQYVATSPFEARLLDRRNSSVAMNPASAARWANIPVLSNLDSPDLARILREDDAVEELRSKVRGAFKATSPGADPGIEIERCVADIEIASRNLERKVRTTRAYGGAFPFITTATAAAVTIGLGGGAPAIAVGALTSLSAISAYLGARKNEKRDASYIFVMARKAASRARKGSA